MVRAEPLRVAPRNAGSADKAKLELEQEVGFPFFCLYKSEEGGGGLFFYYASWAWQEAKATSQAQEQLAVQFQQNSAIGGL